MVLILTYQIFYYGPRMKQAEEIRRAREAAEMLAEQERQARVAREDTTRAALEAGDERDAPGDGTTDVVTDDTMLDVTADGLPRAQTDAAGTITVSSPLYEITLSTAGAEIHTTRLLRFETFGEPVQIFRLA